MKILQIIEKTENFSLNGTISNSILASTDSIFHMTTSYSFLFCFFFVVFFFLFLLPIYLSLLCSNEVIVRVKNVVAYACLIVFY